MKSVLTLTAALAVLALAGVRPALAQGFEVIGISQQTIDESRIADSQPGTVEGDLTFAVTRRGASLVFPLSFAGGDTLILNTLSFSEFEVEIGNLPASAQNDFPQNFYGRSFSLALIQKLGPVYSLTLLASVGRFEDKDPPTGDSERTTAGAILNRRFSEQVTLGIGVVQSSDTGEIEVWPALRYKFQGDSLHVNVGFPDGVDVRYLPGGVVQYGAAVRLQGAEYSITQSSTVDTLKYSVGTARLYTVIGPETGVQLTLGAGSTFRRRYDTLLGETDVRSVDLENASFVEAKLALVF